MDYFSEIRGQERAVRLLQNSIENDNVSHAYVFLGPSGVGKMLTARAFACALLQRGDEQAAIYLKDGVHPDLLIIEKPENKTTILKEQISQGMEPWLALKPYRAANRVVIIRDAHLMRAEAANALLKTLEEPPWYAVIILLTDEQSLLETIMSRCQQVRFFPLSEAVIEQLLVERGIDREIAVRAARLSLGSLGDALEFAGGGEIPQAYEIAGEILLELAGGEMISVFNAAERMEANPELISGMLETMLRDLVIYKYSGRLESLALPDNLKVVQALQGQADPAKIRGALQQLDDLRRNYRRHVNALIVSTNISYMLWEALQ
ncbi:MAG: ATP-binding protein [Deltaproteobacteria bacterium]